MSNCTLFGFKSFLVSFSFHSHLLYDFYIYINSLFNFSNGREVKEREIERDANRNFKVAQHFSQIDCHEFTFPC